MLRFWDIQKKVSKSLISSILSLPSIFLIILKIEKLEFKLFIYTIWIAEYNIANLFIPSLYLACHRKLNIVSGSEYRLKKSNNVLMHWILNLNMLYLDESDPLPLPSNEVPLSPMSLHSPRMSSPSPPNEFSLPQWVFNPRYEFPLP